MTQASKAPYCIHSALCFAWLRVREYPLGGYGAMLPQKILKH